MAMRRFVSVVVVVLVSAAGAVAADYEFYGRSGDLIEIDLGSLPGVPAGATFSNLAVGGSVAAIEWFSHSCRVSYTLSWVPNGTLSSWPLAR